MPVQWTRIGGTEMGTLVVGYDGSECAGAALDAAAEMAKGLGDRIVLAFGYGPGGPGEEYIATREAVRAVGERVTAEGVERARADGIEVEVALVEERPTEALLSLASKHDARAIVVGTYGEHPIRGAILGSTPHKLLHLSERPVLVVPVPE
jgi:nucleotide-binding universal stress UspA family protein